MTNTYENDFAVFTVTETVPGNFALHILNKADQSNSLYGFDSLDIQGLQEMFTKAMQQSSRNVDHYWRLPKTEAEIKQLVSQCAFRPFTQGDWMGFSGCENEKPLICETKYNGEDMTVILDGPVVFIQDMDANSVTLESNGKIHFV